MVLLFNSTVCILLLFVLSREFSTFLYTIVIMTDYNESTQKKFWMFSREQFGKRYFLKSNSKDQIRQDSHDRIVKLVIQNNYVFDTFLYAYFSREKNKLPK